MGLPTTDYRTTKPHRATNHSGAGNMQLTNREQLRAKTRTKDYWPQDDGIQLRVKT